MSNWKPVSTLVFLFLCLGTAVVAGLQVFSEQHWVPLLDSANLALHEAGHPIVGLVSSRLCVYGGTMFQLIFPLLVAREFRRQGHTAGLALALIWLGENLMNIGRYMADARAQVLPLVGGGEHDWTEIFSRWGVLPLDTRIGGFTRFLGLVLMAYALIWLWRRIGSRDSQEMEDWENRQ